MQCTATIITVSVAGRGLYFFAHFRLSSRLPRGLQGELHGALRTCGETRCWWVCVRVCCWASCATCRAARVIEDTACRPFLTVHAPQGGPHVRLPSGVLCAHALVAVVAGFLLFSILCLALSLAARANRTDATSGRLGATLAWRCFIFWPELRGPFFQRLRGFRRIVLSRNQCARLLPL